MRASSKRILSIGLAGFFFIAAFFVYGQFIRDYVKEVNEKRGELLAKVNLFKNQDGAIKQVQNTISNFKNFKDIQTKINLAIPDGIKTISSVRQIEAISNRTSTSIKSLKFRNIAQRRSKKIFLKKLGVLEASLSVEGEYKKLSEFLRLLETNVRITNVQGFDFAPSDDGKFVMSLKVEIYYQNK